MALRIPFTAIAATLALTGCLDQRLGRGDRYRDLRGESPPRPGAPLQIAAPASAAAAGDGNVKPAVFRPAENAQAVQSAGAVQPAASPARQLYDKAATRWATMDSYIVRLKRREVVNGKAQPEEMMLVKFRKDPYSIYFKWIGSEAKGREVVYVKDRYENKIHTLTAGGEFLLVPPGMVFKADVDSPLVRARCRFPITEADLGTTVRRYGQLIDRTERGDHSLGTVKYVGPIKRPEYEQSIDLVVQVLAPKSDPSLPGGGERHWHFDPHSNLPMLIFAFDQNGQETEYYCHDRLICPAALNDNDFNPDVLWKKASVPPK